MAISDILLIALIVVTAGVGLAYVLIQKHTRYTLEMAKLEHFGDLRDVIGKWQKQPCVPAPDNLYIGDVQPELGIENDSNFGSLRSHLKKEKRLWKNYQEFKELRVTYFSKCHDLYKEICKECQEKTGARLGEWVEHEIITASFPIFIYTNTFYHAKGIRGLEDGKYETKSSDDVCQLWFGGKGLVKGSHETVKRCERVHKEMMGSTGRYSEAVNQILKLQRDTEALEDEINKVLDKLSFKRTFQGKCEICS